MIPAEGRGHPPGWLRSGIPGRPGMPPLRPSRSLARPLRVRASRGPLPLMRPRMATPPERVSPSFAGASVVVEVQYPVQLKVIQGGTFNPPPSNCDLQ